MRSASEVEQNIVSVERILHYVGLTPEAPYELPENKPRESWPEKGEVEFRCVFVLVIAKGTIFDALTANVSNYSMRYRPELDLVLADISLKIVCHIPHSFRSEVLKNNNRSRAKRLASVDGRVLESPR